MKKFVLILLLIPTAIFAQYTGGSGDGYTSKIVIVDSPSLSDNDLDIEIDEITVYPNPTANIVRVNFKNEKNSNINIKVFDLLGKVIKDESLTNNNFEINLSNQKTGVFILQIWDKETLIATKKLMKK